MFLVFNKLSKKFQGSFKRVLAKFQWYFQIHSFKGVSRKIEGCFKGDFSGFQGYLKEVQSNFREVSKEFQGSLKTTFGGRRISLEDDLQWKMTFGGI